jgi:glycosyltransferase involved in cell wall biosynthesis
MKKFALISHILPPSPSGQAVMLYRILSCISEKNYYLIHTRARLSSSGNDAYDRNRLPGMYYFLPPEPVLKTSYPLGLSWFPKVVNVFIRFFVRVKNMLRIVRREVDTRAIVVCTGDIVDIPAGYLVSWICKLPFYAYIFDDYLYQFTGSERWIAKLAAPFIFKRSAGIIGPNEFICREYEQRYGAKTVLVRNPCNKTELEQEPQPVSSELKRSIRILYTGDVYLANHGCFRNLIRAMKLLPEYPFELHIFTTRSPEELKSEGIESERTFIHPHLPYGEILEQQRVSDILFLPLAFEPPIPEIIRTSAPGKLGEYLASGRPVLAHVPADSFVAYYLQKNQCGLVASENDPVFLKDKLLKLINDKDFSRTVAHHARQRAKLDFDPQVASETLVDFLSISAEKKLA